MRVIASFSNFRVKLHFVTLATKLSDLNPIENLEYVLDFDSAKPPHCNLQQLKHLVPEATSLQRGKTPYSNKCSGYDTKHSDSEVPVMLELWRKWSTPSLPPVPGPHWPGVVGLDRVLSMS